MKSRQLFLLFVPVILFVSFMLFVEIVQFESTKPKVDPQQQTPEVLIPISLTDPLSGERKAPNTLVVFEDLGCEGCKAQHNILKETMQKHPGSIKIVWKLLPVTRFPYPTELVHKNAYCAHKQGKFDVFADTAFVNYQNLSETTIVNMVEYTELDTKRLQTCLQSGEPEAYIEKTQSIANLLNIQGVPRIFHNNVQLPHIDSVEKFEQILKL